MNKLHRLLGLLAVLTIFVSSTAVEGRKDFNNPWANYQKYGRRLSNRNRSNDKVNSKASVPATYKAKSSANSESAREGKNLRNTFPFNSAASAGRNAAGNGRRASQGIASSSVLSGLAPPPVDTRGSRQRGNSGDDVALDIGSIAAAGERCIDKVVVVQETEYDDVVTCKHSYSEKCHVTYVTDFTPTQEEKCEENFKKSCFIEYKKKASPEKVQLCFTPLVKNCNTPGPTECTTEYTSECTTRYEQHDVADDTANCEDIYEEKCEDVTQGYSTTQQCTKWPVKKCRVENGQVKKFSPVTECKKVPFELCGPGACPVEPGPEECREETRTVVVEVPEETCNLEPQKECKHVTKLVPHLKSRENCIDIPKEVCSRSRTNPRKVDKPIVKKWCYNSLGPKPTRRPSSGGGGGNNNQGRRTTTPRPGGNDSRRKTTPRRQTTRRTTPRRQTTRRTTPRRQTTRRTTQRRRTTRPIKQKSCNGPKYEPDYCVRKRNDGTCNPECNTRECGFDGKDCKKKPKDTYLPPQRGYD